MERPVARTGGLVVKAVGDEVLVYDLGRQRAHSLNRVAAALWRPCDGTRTEAEIATRLRDVEGIPTTRQAVRYGLHELGRARLVSGSRERAELTRRELIRRLGTAALAVPTVTSIVAPTAAQAQSCLPRGASCIESSQCCPGLICPAANTACCGGVEASCTSNADCCASEQLICQGGLCLNEA